MPSASRSASVAAFLRRHILSVMGNPVALGAKRTKHANLDMVDGINGFNLASLE